MYVCTPLCTPRLTHATAPFPTQTLVALVFRSCDPGGTGVMPVDRFKAALDKLALGLSEEDKERVIQRLGAERQDGTVSYHAFLR